jgi:hypothetical protein
MSNLSLKVHFNNETRRVSIKNNVSFTELAAKLRAMFAELPEGFTIRYRDSDNDVITVNTDDELAEAIRLALRDPEAILRLGVVAKPAAKPAAPQEQQQGGHCHRGRGNWWGRNRGHCGQQPQQQPAEPQSPFGQHPFGGLGQLLELIARRAHPQQEADGLEVHLGVRCDGCSEYPLVGVRHKSLVKHDFDLCEDCFAKDANKEDYFVVSSEEQSAPAPAAAPKPAEPVASSPVPSAPVVEEVKPVEFKPVQAEVKPVGVEAPSKPAEVPLAASTEPVNKFEQMLNTLKDMGFEDRQRSIQVLVRHRGNLVAAIQQLLNEL